MNKILSLQKLEVTEPDTLQFGHSTISNHCSSASNECGE